MARSSPGCATRTLSSGATIPYSAPKKPQCKGGRRKKFPEHTPEIAILYQMPDKQRVCTCGGALHGMVVESVADVRGVPVRLDHDQAMPILPDSAPGAAHFGRTAT